ncbi:phosphoenolpyruvate carboxykinase (ATP) [Enterococcus rivorum]|uniref:phosphoenolpyruvate carboxykinase (ATP) n=1 Tax=Enterococcus rivorum TaxID=762845 RepID=A0A1E5KTE4_9ENTE|nr:phosphoenolpyruvate carboxykinase (ATP) [Enterococcus rivorum]MBP2100710.1 phosphoenolpyruvate carboxykinase (ATP) [Enterococcus rivorum]OEH81154.1 phosphoenolpyruvate carboxykinase [Enterococcus rivorum]
MSTIEKYSIDSINHENALFSSFRSIVESSFYGNNVKKVTTIAEAYSLAENSLGTIVTDLPIYKPEELGIPENAKILVNNDGKVFGRTASARRIIGQPTIDKSYYEAILREAVFHSSKQNCYHSEVIVGLEKNFMVKAHLMIPQGYENLLYSYLLNFQEISDKYSLLYNESVFYHEGDLYLFSDPDWEHPDFPDELAIFDPDHNAAAILGLRYFGELKKATLTLAWNIAHRNHFIACHGGMKQYKLSDGKKYTMAAFGLSGSGKSTITLSKHNNKFDVSVLHDDAFVISEKNGSTIALEPAYFDKTQDYPMSDETIKYFLTCQNIGIILDDTGRKVLVTEDIRNGNGRTIKSRLVTPNRVDYLSEKINAIFWIMKDDSLPPIIKITNPILATVFGVTLATKRSTAENLQSNIDLDSLVIEPFANPFRVYPLAQDYKDFRSLFDTQKADCYILNTGYFNGTKVEPEQTLAGIEAIVEGRSVFSDFGPLASMSYLQIEGHSPDFSNKSYILKLKKRMESRLDFIQEQRDDLDGYNALPEESSLLLQHLILELEICLNTFK